MNKKLPTAQIRYKKFKIQARSLKKWLDDAVKKRLIKI